MIYFAHRGASSLAVQNTLRAFEKARELGARHYELDVHLTADGQLAVHHDYSLLDTAGVDVDIASLTAEELKKIPLKNRFSNEFVFVPLLKEVLQVVSPNLELLNIEIKNEGNRYPEIEKKLFLCLQEYPQILSKTLFSSFDYETLVRLRRLSENVRIGLLTRTGDVSQALLLKAESLHLNFSRLTPSLIQSCKEHHLLLYCYTVNEIPLAQQLATQGVDGIFTDCLELFQ